MSDDAYGRAVGLAARLVAALVVVAIVELAAAGALAALRLLADVAGAL